MSDTFRLKVKAVFDRLTLKKDGSGFSQTYEIDRGLRALNAKPGDVVEIRVVEKACPACSAGCPVTPSPERKIPIKFIMPDLSVYPRHWLTDGDKAFIECFGSPKKAEPFQWWMVYHPDDLRISMRVLARTANDACRAAEKELKTFSICLRARPI